MYMPLSSKLARVARDTLDDVATPAGSLGCIDSVGTVYATVSVGNSLADDYGDTRYRIADLEIYGGTVAKWLTRGYIRRSDVTGLMDASGPLSRPISTLMVSVPGIAGLTVEWPFGHGESLPIGGSVPRGWDYV